MEGWKGGSMEGWKIRRVRRLHTSILPSFHPSRLRALDRRRRRALAAEDAFDAVDAVLQHHGVDGAQGDAVVARDGDGDLDVLPGGVRHRSTVPGGAEVRELGVAALHHRAEAIRGSEIVAEEGALVEGGAVVVTAPERL